MKYRSLEEMIFLVCHVNFGISEERSDTYCSGQFETNIDVETVEDGEKLAELLMKAGGAIWPNRLMRPNVILREYPTFQQIKENHGCVDAYCQVCGG